MAMVNPHLQRNHRLFTMMFAYGVSLVGMVGCNHTEPAELFANVEARVGSITVEGTKDHPILRVTSNTGIGKASIKSANSAWPNQLSIILSTQGLERFEIANGQTKINAEVSSNQINPSTRVWIEGRESDSLEPTDEYWMSIRKDSNERHFQIEVPSSFLLQSKESIELSWIDFYR